MIVKNESHIIEQTLKNVYEKLGDRLVYYIIEDNGSTDGTQEIIKKYFDSVGVEGEVNNVKWYGFGRTRSNALTSCIESIN